MCCSNFHKLWALRGLKGEQREHAEPFFHPSLVLLGEALLPFFHPSLVLGEALLPLLLLLLLLKPVGLKVT